MNARSSQTLILLIFGYCCLSLTPAPWYAVVGLDASWAEAMLMTINQGKVFGRDFIFNYGPLGFLNVRVLPEYFSGYALMLVDFLTIGHLIYFLRKALLKEGASRIWTLVGAGMLLWPWGFFADFSFTYFFFFLFWLLEARTLRKIWPLFLAALLSVMIVFVKVNLSLIVVLLFLIALLYFVWVEKFPKKTVFLAFVVQILGIALGAWSMRVDLWPYLRYSMDMIASYPDGMSVIQLSKKYLFVLLGLEGLMALGLVVYIIKEIKSFWSYLPVYAFVGITAFLGFKQAHIAISNLNMFGFFLLLPMLGLMLYLFTDVKSKSAYLLAWVLTCQIAATSYIRWVDHIAYKPVSFSPITYFKGIVSYEYAHNFDQNPIPLSPRVRAMIGNETVDAMNNDLSMIYFNRLNYNPRPVVQTYAAHSALLADVNGAKYRSSTGPTFVLYKLDEFRWQNPFWADSEANEALLTHYSLIDTARIGGQTFHIFKRLNKPRTVPIRDMHIRMERGKEVFFPKGALVKLTVDMDFTFVEKLVRFAFQPPLVYADVRYEDGQKRTFRVSDKIMKGGVLGNVRVTDQSELETFFRFHGQRSVRAISVRFYMPSVLPRFQ
jgi:hypothetical protein